MNKKGDRLAPTRRDINPVEIPDLLGFVNIFEVQENPRDYLIRLNGSEVSAVLGREVTGKLCSSIMTGDDAARAKVAFDMCVDECIPTIVETSLAFCGKPYLAQKIVILPLCNDGDKVDMLVSCHSYRKIESDGAPIELNSRRAGG
jgi:hypothetical protein